MPGTSRGIASSSSFVSGASTNRKSAPASWIRARPVERRLEPLDRAGIGTGEDHQVRIHARIDGGLELRDHLGFRDHVLAVEVSAALRICLVLEHDRVGAGALQQLDGAARVDRVAEAGIRVGEDRYVHRLAHRRDVARELRHRDQPDVRHAEVGVRHRRTADHHHSVARRPRSRAQPARWRHPA